MSDIIQNEMTQIFAHEVQSNICEEAQRSSFFELHLTQPLTYKQFTYSLHYVDASFVPHNVFLGFHIVPDSKLEKSIDYPSSIALFSAFSSSISANPLYFILNVEYLYWFLFID